ncbi:3-dehydroquinate synthase [Aminipila luticellarii]|uniref:3-dehydroquinate synthase n=1 Tax=Aminipila luticellarii TaxID=2507160 RepID=A0A410PSC8_9FIRM|nr:3-dehydroquinate synthase [Aminipila luticellarii]QAT41795.1 3-dehydroquinate synthase [Aminipila luticellarii]
MEKIQVKASRTYDIYIGRNLLKDAGMYISEILPTCKLCIITDDVVSELYKDTVSQALSDAGFDVHTFVFKAGENSKNMETVHNILEYMAENEFTRSDGIVALGGGITGDIAGFAAAIFLRGIQFIQIPTTFLAAVDSSVGGKTGVNLHAGKNLTGAFWQPSLVLCDCDTFSTLSYEIFLDGVAEAVKYGVIISLELFELLLLHNQRLFSEPLVNEKPDHSDAVIEVVKQCVQIKRDLVMEDEQDTGIRQLLNFGHTVGHAIEKCSGYTVTHGHAVAMGMLIISKAAHTFGLCKTDCFSAIEEILKTFNFPVTCPYTAEELTRAALKDKKRAGKSITLVLPEYIGHCYLKKTDISNLEAFIKAGL